MLGYQILRWDAPDQEAGLSGGLWSQEPSADTVFEQEIEAGAQRAVLLEAVWDEDSATPMEASRQATARFRFEQDEMSFGGLTVRVISRYESVGKEEEGEG